MKRFRAFTMVLAVLAGMALAPIALAGPDPHGHGGGKDHGGGKPSPSATAEPSPVVELAPAPEPVVDESSAPEAGPSDPAAAAPTEDTQSSNGQGGGSGIIKLDRQPFDQAPNNEPHVGCTFQVDFYNYPKGITARYTFSLWHPTGPAALDDASGSLELQNDDANGGQDLDGEVEVDLGPALNDSGIEPHRHNGWHVKLVVRARSTSGADQKQKVFWVRECAAQATTEPPVLPSTVTPPAPIAFTGSEIARLGAFGLLALVLGSGALWFSARLRRERP